MAESEVPLQASATDFVNHAEKLSLLPQNADNQEARATTAVKAKFITPQDPVIETADGSRLPTVPVAEAAKLNQLKDQVKTNREASVNDISVPNRSSEQSNTTDAPLSDAYPPQRTHPLFPQLPLYGPPSLLRNLQCCAFRTSSFFLSLAFLGTIVLGSAFTSIPLMLKHIGLRLTFRNPDARRPFHEEEKKRREIRKSAAREWKRQRRRRRRDQLKKVEGQEEEGPDNEFQPTEGGSDPILCDVGYYARRVGLDMEEYKVQTEDGFIITLWHLYNPLEYTPVSAEHRDYRAPHIFTSDAADEPGKEKFSGQRKYPVLMIHGLLQSSGAYCTNDDNSLAFFLCKSGYDVWLGNNRCGFKPHHHMLRYGDPRMWNWNIRQMGVMDLPALLSRVLAETGFEKLGLICHSQGTTETFVALAKEQRPDLGSKISVFCALAPAVYAGPLIGKAYLKFMRVISPGMFRIVFGIHAFIPIMMTMHQILPAKLYGALGYRVFSFLFNWSDARWDRDLRDRMFQFAPVYVSSESMRWWLGRECFAKHKCILATKDEWMQEDMEDEGLVAQQHGGSASSSKGPLPTTTTATTTTPSPDDSSADDDLRHSRGHRAWYDSQVPPFALWVAGSDELVDGHRLLRRFERGREPHVRIVHSKIIPEYEHLDVIWAMDSIEKVGKEVREVIWKTIPEGVRDACRVPRECEKVKAWGGGG